jgi:hypothetical protein
VTILDKHRKTMTKRAEEEVGITMMRSSKKKNLIKLQVVKRLRLNNTPRC